MRHCAYAVSGGEWIGYDDVETICAKLAFARCALKDLGAPSALGLDVLSLFHRSFTTQPIPLLVADFWKEGPLQSMEKYPN